MYVDTCALIKLYVPESDSDKIQAAVFGRAALITAELSVVETASVLARHVREGRLAGAGQKKIWDALARHIQAGYWTLAGLNADTYRLASDLIFRCPGYIPLRTLDALHLAVCIENKAFPLCTLDGVMRKAAQYFKISVISVD